MSPLLGPVEGGHLVATYRRYAIIWWHWRLELRQGTRVQVVAEGACLRKKNAEAAVDTWHRVWLRANY